MDEGHGRWERLFWEDCQDSWLASWGRGRPCPRGTSRSGTKYEYSISCVYEALEDCDFSFAVWKISVRLAVRKLGGESVVRAHSASCFQRTTIKHLEDRTRRSLDLLSGRPSALNTLVVAVGVAANAVVRSRLLDLAEEAGWRMVVASPKLCAHSGVMVAWAGVERQRLSVADRGEDLNVRGRRLLGRKVAMTR